MSRFRFDRATSLFTMCRSSMVPLPPLPPAIKSIHIVVVSSSCCSRCWLEHTQFFFIRKLVLFCNERLTSFSQSCSVLPTVFFLLYYTTNIIRRSKSCGSLFRSLFIIVLPPLALACAFLFLSEVSSVVLSLINNAPPPASCPTLISASLSW